MSFEYKLVIILVVVGSLNLILRKNRNWIFGYRSPRAIKTHERFAYANTIYGWGMVAAGTMYLMLLACLDDVYFKLANTTKIIFLISFFAVLVIIIELKLSRAFKD